MTDWDKLSMPEKVISARTRVEADFAAELRACTELCEIALSSITPWAGAGLRRDRPADLLLAAVLARTTNTYWSAVEQARMGFGEQASMLNRSLFEDMVDAHWITVEPKLAVKRYEQHHTHSQLLAAEVVRAHRPMFGDVELPDLPEDRRSELDRIFGRHGARSWTGLGVHNRVKAIEHLWETDESKDTLHFFQAVAHRDNNQQLHLSASALNRVVREHDAQGLTMKFGPGPELIDTALFGSFWIYAQTLTLMIDHFELPGRDQVDTLCANSAVIFAAASE